MKIILPAFVCLAVAASLFWARNTAGVGITFGDPAEAAGKVWNYRTQAVDAGVRSGKDLTAYSGYLWYSWTALPSSAKAKLPVYLDLAAPGGSPVKPAAAAVKTKREARGKDAAWKGASLRKKGEGPEKLVKKRKKRVSRLRDPGEAMGGGVHLDRPADTAGLKRQTKGASGGNHD